MIKTVEEMLAVRDAQKLLMHAHIGHLNGATCLRNDVPEDVKKAIGNLYNLAMENIFEYTPEQLKEMYDIR